jgi:hypothetical protein
MLGLVEVVVVRDSPMPMLLFLGVLVLSPPKTAFVKIVTQAVQQEVVATMELMEVAVPAVVSVDAEALATIVTAEPVELTPTRKWLKVGAARRVKLNGTMKRPERLLLKPKRKRLDSILRPRNLLTPKVTTQLARRST